MNFLFPELLPLLVFLTFLILIIIYFGAHVFRIPGWESYFNIELHNIFFVLIIISVVFGAFEISRHISQAIIGEDPIHSSQSFLNLIINKGVLPIYNKLLFIELGCTLSNAFYGKIGPYVASYDYKIKPGTDSILAMARTLNIGLIVIYVSLLIQYIGISLIPFAMQILFSLGVLLFVFPPTREAGAFLIAFSFAFLIIFPFCYALNKVILNDIWELKHGVGNTYEKHVQKAFGLAKDLGLPAAALFTPFVNSWLNFGLFIPLINEVAHLALISLFMPAFSLTITIASINAITNFLLGRI